MNGRLGSSQNLGVVPSAHPQKACQIWEEFSGRLWYCAPEDVSVGIGPTCLGLLTPTLPYISKPGSPLTQACGE